MFELLLVIFAVALLAGLVAIGCILTLSMPKSRSRDVVQSVLIAILSALYVLMPVDIMPAALLGPIGGADDITVLLMAIKKIKERLHRQESSESLNVIETH